MTDDITTKTKGVDKPANGKSKFPTLTIDWDLYGTYLEGSDMTDAQKRDVIQMLWNIMVAFADLGFRAHPVQLATSDASSGTTSSNCGQNQDLADFITAESGPMVESDGKSTPQFNTAADGSAEPSPKRSHT